MKRVVGMTAVFKPGVGGGGGRALDPDEQRDDGAEFPDALGYDRLRADGCGRDRDTGYHNERCFDWRGKYPRSCGRRQQACVAGPARHPVESEQVVEEQCRLRWVCEGGGEDMEPERTAAVHDGESGHGELRALLRLCRRNRGGYYE